MTNPETSSPKDQRLAIAHAILDLAFTGPKPGMNQLIVNSMITACANVARDWPTPLYDPTTTAERDAAYAANDATVAAYQARALAAESLNARQAEALKAIVTAWRNATSGNGNAERDLGWTGSQDNWGQIFAWYAERALATESGNG